MKTIKKIYGFKGQGAIGITAYIPEDRDEVFGGSIWVHPQLWGRAATFEDVVAALYWGDDNIGEDLEAAADRAHAARPLPWRVEIRRGMSGCVDYIVRIQDETAKEYGTAGRITSSLHISCAGKMNRGFHAGLADWYVLLKTIPSRPWEEIEAAYTECPPRELRPVSEDVWHAPGAEPWEGNSITPEGEKEEDGRREYTLEEIRERVRANYAGEDEEPAEQDTPQSTGKLISTFHNPNIYDPFNLMDR